MGLYLRDLPDITLADIADELNSDSDQWGGVTNEAAMRVDGDRLTLAFGGHEVPATADGIEQLASFLDVPRGFATRLDPDLKANLFTELMRRNPANVTFRYDDSGVHEVYQPDRTRLEPAQIVDTAIRVMTPDAQIVEWHSNPDELFIDVMVPENFDRGIGGDLEVGDTTRGGLRFFQNRKQNLAPNVNSFLYRLICTNGMVVPQAANAVDARGQSVEEVLAELERAAERAFSEVEEQIEHFYAMREQRIEGDVTQAVIQVAAERGLPTRTAMTLATRVPDLLDPETLGHEVSMFDVVNLITNQANDPAIRHRQGPRRTLEMAGGRLVQEVRDRCHSCHQTLN